MENQRGNAALASAATQRLHGRAWDASVTAKWCAEPMTGIKLPFAGWRQHYAARFSDQTYYQFPRKPG
jgi:hypothetical protein